MWEKPMIKIIKQDLKPHVLPRGSGQNFLQEEVGKWDVLKTRNREDKLILLAEQ
jgi:hypothetical protein